jgi:tRNA (guanosine-2'-O-)-methyltransferase
MPLSAIERTPDEVIAILGAHVTPGRLERMRAVAARRTRWLTLVCERFYDLHNVAACMRTADAFGLQEVHAVIDQSLPAEHERRPPRDVVLADDIARSVSLKAERWVDRLEHATTGEALSRLRARGYRIALATPEDTRPIGRVPLERPLALVMGSERDGVSPEALADGDLRVGIPMRGFVQSLNVSVAFAVLMAPLRERLEQELPSERWSLSDGERRALVARWLAASVPHAAAILARATTS